MALSILRRLTPLALRTNLVPSTSISCISEKPKRGWFPAGLWMSIMESSQRQGVRIMAHHITLRSAQPLNADIIVEAFRHLYRKSPPLRACLKIHNEKLWICEMKEEVIDFEELETSNPLREVKSKISIPFKPLGPLWRVQYLPLSLESLPPHTGLHLPYECQLIIYIHHGICDGWTCFRMWGTLIKIINDLMSGKPIDNKQLGEMCSEKGMANIKISLLGKVDNEELKKIYNARRKESLLLKAFKPPLVRNLSTGFILKHLDIAETQYFIQKCKKAGITINSALVSIVNTAIVELVKQKMVEHEDFDISYNIAVDNRRYFQEDASDKLGCIVGILTHGMKTPVNVRDIFWDYAKDLHKSLSNSYNEAEHLQQEMLWERQQSKDFSYEKYISGIPPVLTDFFFSNPGDITKGFGSKGSQVEMTAMIPYISMPKLQTNGHLFHSYHGSLQYLFVFSEYYIDNCLAHRLADTVIDLIKTV
ncbi:unnamed protein product [Meganyctiphanes norvegica]|uniref:Condensation domain-containing protein n=1 Tax=Meganyctiphanes norvegica TaxID=48144 RepID=A0AAV2QAI0_MEGNR